MADEINLENFYKTEQKLTASQKNRLKKKQKQYLQQLQEEQDRLNVKDKGKEELETLEKLLRLENLQIRHIKGDGNCLFKSVEDQLSISQNAPKYDHLRLRHMVVQHLREHREDYEPFIYGSDIHVEDYASYCDKMAKDGEWGGEIELRAMTEILQCKIVIYNSEQPPIIYVSTHEDGVKYYIRNIEYMAAEAFSHLLIYVYLQEYGVCLFTLNLSLHKYLYSLGYHYNSVVPIV